MYVYICMHIYVYIYVYEMHIYVICAMHIKYVLDMSISFQLIPKYT